MAPFLFLITWWTAWLAPKPQRPLYAYSFYVLLGCVLIVMLIKTYNAYDEAWHPQVMVNKACNVYIGPNRNYGVSTTLAQGEIVRLYQKETSWCKIKRHNLMGWVPLEDIG